MKNAWRRALQLLARRRMTAARLRERLRDEGYDHADVEATIERCLQERLLDDRLFARFYVESRSSPRGDARLTAELVQRGIDPDEAAEAVRDATPPEESRCAEALARLLRSRPRLTYPAAARALERRGFPATVIYRVLRDHARVHGPLAGLLDDGEEGDPSLVADG